MLCQVGLLKNTVLEVGILKVALRSTSSLLGLLLCQVGLLKVATLKVGVDSNSDSLCSLALDLFGLIVVSGWPP